MGIRGMRSGHRPVVSIDRPLIWETHPCRSNTCRGFGSLLKVCFLALHKLAFLFPSLAVTSAICSHSSCQTLELPHLPAFKLKDGVQHATRMQFFHHRPRTHQNQCRCCWNGRRTILRNLLCIHLVAFIAHYYTEVSPNSVHPVDEFAKECWKSEVRTETKTKNFSFPDTSHHPALSWCTHCRAPAPRSLYPATSPRYRDHDRALRNMQSPTV